MDFKTFKANVEKWADVRCIYEQSTEAHQQAKALEEIGEYLTATNDEERMDAIGDIAVCIVNAFYFYIHSDEYIEDVKSSSKTRYKFCKNIDLAKNLDSSQFLNYKINHLKDKEFIKFEMDMDDLLEYPDDKLDFPFYLSEISGSTIFGVYDSVIMQLYRVSLLCRYDFEKCLEMAWNSIKDRKGMMVNGLYVKWENLTEEQREEFRLRDANNTLLRQ